MLWRSGRYVLKINSENWEGEIPASVKLGDPPPISVDTGVEKKSRLLPNSLDCLQQKCREASRDLPRVPVRLNLS